MQCEIEAFREEHARCAAVLESLVPSDFQAHYQYEVQVEGLRRSMEELQRMWNAARARLAEAEGEEFQYATLGSGECAPGAPVLASGGQTPNKACVVPTQMGMNRVKRVVRVSQGIVEKLENVRPEVSSSRDVSLEEVVDFLLAAYSRAKELESENKRLNNLIAEIALKSAGQVRVVQPVSSEHAQPPPPPNTPPGAPVQVPSQPPAPAQLLPPSRPALFSPPATATLKSPTSRPKAPPTVAVPRDCPGYGGPSGFKDVLREMKDLFRSGVPLLKSAREAAAEEENARHAREIASEFVELVRSHQPVPSKADLVELATSFALSMEDASELIERLRSEGRLVYSRKAPRGYSASKK
ncbi:MAG: hypothetical protein ACTSU5_07630 [Promethearchaeota archaeon]